MPRPQLTLAALTLLGSLFFSGCETYTSQTADRDAAFRSGNFVTAVAIANKDVENHATDKDAILYRLEQGSILRVAALANVPLPTVEGAPVTAVTTQQTATNMAAQANALSPGQAYLAESNKALDSAEEKVNKYEEEAKVKLASETGAILTNQANLPYRGRGYDKVMMNIYKSLNFIRLGDYAAARVELNRALQRQRDAVEENAKEITEAQKIAEEAKAGKNKDEQGNAAEAYDVDRAKSDPKTSAGLSEIESEVDAKILPYGNYVNPFAVLLDGLFFLHQGADASDTERARKSFERVVALSPNNPYAKLDFNDASSGKAPKNVTYVVFETGSAPYRDQVRIDLPIGFLTGRISYVGAAFPKLKYVNDYIPGLVVNSGGEVLPSAMVCSMDSVIAQDFKNEWPTILTKTIISTVTKATMDAVIQNQARQQLGAGGQLLTMLATGITQAAVNIADTRSWRSLPKEFHYVRLNTPANRQISLSTGALQAPVTIEPGSVNVVYVKSISSTSPLIISQLTLAK